MHKRYNFDSRSWENIRLTLIKDYHNSLHDDTVTHVPLPIFTTLVSVNLKLPDLTQTVLFDKLKECLVVGTQTEEDQVSLENLSLLVDLFEFLPLSR